jgi:hypothetical protein
MNLDLTDAEADALAKLLTRTIDGDHYFLSSRVQTQRTILTKLRSEPPREPLPPYAPPSRGRYRRRG